jgi:hypothetical protein
MQFVVSTALKALTATTGNRTDCWNTPPEFVKFDMYEGSTEGRVRFKRLGRIVKPRTTQTGYHHISVRGKASDRQQGVCVSRFIYSCFNEDFHPSSHLQIDHLNDNRTDNRLSNLEPITRQQNNKKAQINRDMKKITCGICEPILAENSETHDKLLFKSKYQCGKYFGRSAAMVYFAFSSEKPGEAHPTRKRHPVAHQEAVS